MVNPLDTKEQTQMLNVDCAGQGIEALYDELEITGFLDVFANAEEAEKWIDNDKPASSDFDLYGPSSWTGDLTGGPILAPDRLVPEAFWLVRLMRDAPGTLPHMADQLRSEEAARFVLDTYPDVNLVAMHLEPFSKAAFWLEFVKKEPEMFSTLPQDLRDNLELATVACARHAEASAHLGRRVLCNREFYNGLDRLEPVQFDYRLMPLELRRDFDVVRTALVAGYFRFNDGDPDAAAFRDACSLSLTPKEAIRTRGFRGVVLQDRLMNQVRQYLRQAGYQANAVAPVAVGPQGGVEAEHGAAVDSQDGHERIQLGKHKSQHSPPGEPKRLRNVLHEIEQ